MSSSTDYRYVVLDLLRDAGEDRALKILTARIVEQLLVINAGKSAVTGDNYRNFETDVREVVYAYRDDWDRSHTDALEFIRDVRRCIRIGQQDDAYTIDWMAVTPHLRSVQVPSVLLQRQEEDVGTHVWWRTESMQQNLLRPSFEQHRVTNLFGEESIHTADNAPAREKDGAIIKRDPPRWRTLASARLSKLSISQPIRNMKLFFPGSKDPQYKYLHRKFPMCPIRCDMCIRRDLACLMPVVGMTTCMNCNTHKFGCNLTGYINPVPEYFLTDVDLPGETLQEKKARLRKFDETTPPKKPLRCLKSILPPDMIDPGYETQYGTEPAGVPEIALYGSNWHVAPSYEPGKPPGWKHPTRKKRSRKTDNAVCDEGEDESQASTPAPSLPQTRRAGSNSQPPEAVTLRRSTRLRKPTIKPNNAFVSLEVRARSGSFNPPDDFVSYDADEEEESGLDLDDANVSEDLPSPQVSSWSYADAPEDSMIDSPAQGYEGEISPAIDYEEAFAQISPAPQPTPGGASVAELASAMIDETMDYVSMLEGYTRRLRNHADELHAVLSALGDANASSSNVTDDSELDELAADA